MLFVGDIGKLTLENNNFRKVIATNKYQQLVLMSLKPKEEIGKEVHKKVDQFFRVEKGTALAVLGKNGEESYKLKKEHVIVIPAGTYHNIINIGKGDLKMYTIYAPPNHKPNTINKTKPLKD